MSYAPATISAARTLILKTLPKMDPMSVGIVGDDAHAKSGTSYHLGKDALRSGSYSVVESSRDAHPTNAASALDFGTFKAGDHNLRTFSKWLVDQCKAGTADTKDIREVIYSLDGKTVKRWDRLGKRAGGPSSHTTHTHISWFRDSESRDKARLFRRYFEHIGLIKKAPPRKVTMEKFTGQLPIIKYGDNDATPITPDGTWWVARVQRQLQIDADGDYGPATAAAVKKFMGKGDGKTVDLEVWIKLYALWGAKPV